MSPTLETTCMFHFSSIPCFNSEPLKITLWFIFWFLVFTESQMNKPPGYDGKNQTLTLVMLSSLEWPVFIFRFLELAWNASPKASDALFLKLSSVTLLLFPGEEINVNEQLENCFEWQGHCMMSVVPLEIIDEEAHVS